MSQHHATFNWGAGPNSVHISGGFNNWSATASPLHKQQDGTFTAQIPLPWGEKQAFKYVVDGEWKVREDEAKEWDAAGNMNNVYTAPPQPAEEHKAAPVVAAAAAPAAVGAAAGAAAVSSKSHSEPSTAERAPEPAPVPAIAKAEPSNLVAASAPSAASTGSSQLQGYALGAPISGAHAASIPASSTSVSAAPAAQLPTPAGPATIEKTISSAEQIEKTAAKANVGEAPIVPQEEGILEKATALGATALAGIGAYVGAAAVAVEKATGVDLTHGQPTIAEAKAAGLDLNRIEKRDAETDTVSPVGTKPPSAAVDDLSRKVEDLKVGSASVPKHEQHANDLPAQNETSKNHQTVPMPVITAISEKDPKKDRSLEGGAESSTAKPIGTDPSISAKEAKVEAQTNPGKTGSTLSQVHGSSPAAGASIPAGGAIASPDRAETNPHVPAPPKKDTSGINTAPATSIGQAPQPKAATPASTGGPIATPAAATAFAATTPSPAVAASTPTKPVAVTPVAAVPAAVAPSTPAKASAPAAQNGTPSSIQTTPASTPVKTAHGKESTSGSDVRKRKSSFFHKLKTAFSPKDKEKK